ncbi:sterile alpha motif domain-containing protein 9-like isoform X2 [Danio aesculapii]|uniref:sterile alpha motif domain-containing protein 9-like isoform X2 n=1 Tax=Danio aesculapii TaxID=1142201 RepID=UPI0024C036A1|nr:sterile alpha motif domain-containing protein 9-like isoform X2 [Danio aesculapii]
MKDSIKAMAQGEPANSTKGESTEHEKLPETWKELKNMEDWTKDHVHQWLIDMKVDQKYADILYKEDVKGACLNLFEKQDFLDAGLKHGPAVQILKNVALFRTSSDGPKDTTASVGDSALQHSEQENVAAESPTTGSAELSIEENGTSTRTWLLQAKHADDKGKSLNETSENHDEVDGMSGEQSQASSLTTQQAQNVESKTTEHPSGFIKPLKILITHFCKPRPFDTCTGTFQYIQKEILPPETGPSNLLDPVHEYKLLVNTANAAEKDVLEKFSNETFWFAAGCMNDRTNGTIHFGVGDEPQYKHGQIIGLELTSPNKYIDEFDTGLKEHFKGKSNIARACIRPPVFVPVICKDSSIKWVIEIDIVPMYKLTKRKRFYTTLDKKKRKSKCFFIRSGANTMNYLPKENPKIYKQNCKTLNHYVELRDIFRQSAEDEAQQLVIVLQEGQSPAEFSSNLLQHAGIKGQSEDPC